MMDGYFVHEIKQNIKLYISYIIYIIISLIPQSLRLFILSLNQLQGANLGANPDRDKQRSKI